MALGVLALLLAVRWCVVWYYLCRFNEGPLTLSMLHVCSLGSCIVFWLPLCILYRAS